jgi:hypothetical protein
LSKKRDQKKEKEVQKKERKIEVNSKLEKNQEENTHVAPE